MVESGASHAARPGVTPRVAPGTRAERYGARGDHEEVGRYWDDNAKVWTKLVRAGYDHYRDGLNTPAFLEMLPDVSGLSGLDVGCGEGHNTRLITEQGALVTAIDISRNFVRKAREAGHQRPLVIQYELASAVDLPYEGELVGQQESFGEPCPSDEAVRERPGLQDAQIVAYFLPVRARKQA